MITGSAKAVVEVVVKVAEEVAEERAVALRVVVRDRAVLGMFYFI